MYYAVYHIYSDAFTMTIKAFFAILTKPIYASQLNIIIFVAQKQNLQQRCTIHLRKQNFQGIKMEVQDQ